MPRARYCRRCRNTHKGDCPKRQAESSHYDNARGTRTERGYDNNYFTFRKWFLDEHPFCQDCLDEGKQLHTSNPPNCSEQIHHIIKMKYRKDLACDPDNCMALCISHHNIRTARGE